MYYKKFRDIELPALGFGALRFPMDEKNPDRIDREKSLPIIEKAYKGGINFFDTAYIYQNGDSERFLGEVLSEYPRESYFLSTKFYAPRGIPIRQAFEEQLERCRTEYFDFYLLHGMDESFIDLYMNQEFIDFLNEEKASGRIRYIGFSSHAAPATLRRFLKWYDGFDMAIIQLNYLDWKMLDAKGQYEILTEYGIPVWVMEPLKGGRLAELSEEAAGILKTAAPERSIASWGMRFLQGLPNVQVVMSGMSTIEQVEDNLKTFEKPEPLSEKEKKILLRAADLYHKELGVPCSACRYCVPYCPVGLNIPLLIKGLNEWNIDRELWKIAELTTAKEPKNCIGCGSCAEHCPQKIDIPGAMSKFAEILSENKIDLTQIS